MCGERKDVDQYLKGLFSVILCKMKDKPSSTVPTPASVVEFKDGTVQAQYRLDGQPIQSVSPSNRPSGLRQLLLSAFMPEGWPNAVTPDYTGRLPFFEFPRLHWHFTPNHVVLTVLMFFG